MPDKDYFVHESSYVDEPCEIGAGTRIWHFSHIMRNSRIGRKCNIGQNVVVSPDCVIGDNVKIQNNVSVYTGVTLEDDVFCGPSMVFTNVINPRSHVERKDEYKDTLRKVKAERQKNQYRKEEIKDTVIFWFITTVIVLCGFAGLAFVIYFIGKSQGKW